MPIYAYRCESCDFAKDVLQKISDAQLTDCPSCSATGTFKKQLSAPGFQLKGSGWYVTDFRGGNTAAKPVDSNAAAAGSAGDSASADKSAGAAAPAAASSTTPSTPSSTPAASSSSST